MACYLYPYHYDWLIIDNYNVERQLMLYINGLLRYNNFYSPKTSMILLAHAVEYKIVNMAAIDIDIEIGIV